MSLDLVFVSLGEFGTKCCVCIIMLILNFLNLVPEKHPLYYNSKKKKEEEKLKQGLKLMQTKVQINIFKQ